MRRHLRPLALLVGLALAAALVVLAPRIGGAELVGGRDAATAVSEAGGAGGEALHRAGAKAPVRALLLLAVLALVGAVVASASHPLTPRPGVVPAGPVSLARAGDRGPPAPPRSIVR
jgi:hypothetical protein